MEAHQLWYWEFVRREEEELVRGGKAFEGKCVFSPILDFLAEPESTNVQ